MTNPDNEDFGSALVYMFLFCPEWQHRKVDSTRLMEGSTSRRRVSIDLTVPNDTGLVVPEGVHRGLIFVPLSVVAKRPLQDFDAQLDGAMSVSIADSELNGWAMAQALDEAVLISTGTPVSPAMKKAIREIVTSQPTQALVADVEVLIATGRWRGSGRRVVDQRKLGDYASNLLRDFALNFVLAALLPAARAGDRTLIKYSYHWSFAAEVTHQPGQSSRDRFLGWLERRVAPFGITPFKLDLPIGTTLLVPASFHFEVHAPVGLTIERLEFLDWDHGTASVEGGSIAHLVGRPDENEEIAQQVRVHFNQWVEGKLKSVAIAAAFSSLLFGLILLVPGVTIAFTDADNRGAASLFLAFPALLIALSARAGENPIVTSLVNPLRTVLFFLALAYFGCGFLVVVGAGEAAFRSLVATVAFLASILTIVSAAGLYECRTRTVQNH